MMIGTGEFNILFVFLSPWGFRVVFTSPSRSLSLPLFSSSMPPPPTACPQPTLSSDLPDADLHPGQRALKERRLTRAFWAPGLSWGQGYHIAFECCQKTNLAIIPLHFLAWEGIPPPHFFVPTHAPLLFSDQLPFFLSFVKQGPGCVTGCAIDRVDQACT